jgi:hypothetical protein
VPREDFFQTVRGKTIDPEHDGMAPFFDRVAKAIRSINNDWLVFAEVDPFRGLDGDGFPPVPERTVNASHWYDIVTLVTKTFMYPQSINPFTMKMLNGKAEIEGQYAAQLGRIKGLSSTIPGGAPTLIGEFGIPFDLDGCAAYEAWAKGDRTTKPWERHVMALDLMYNAMDTHLLSSTQWNYTASNRNDPACGDGWNQEDLSVFSRDQLTDIRDPNSGGRGIDGFVRPYVKATQGVLKSMKFDRETGEFRFVFDADTSIAAPTEVYVPTNQFPDDFVVTGPGLRGDPTVRSGCILMWAQKNGEHTVTIRRSS